MVLRLRFGRFAALFTGDIEKTGEAALASTAGELRAQLLKVAHHGSRSATLEPFLDRARPRWGVISAAKNNPFGHPAREVLLRLLRRGTRPLLTADQGAIRFETDGSRFILSSHVNGTLDSGDLP